MSPHDKEGERDLHRRQDAHRRRARRGAIRSAHGLSGGVIGGDLDRATAVARRIRTGTMSVNGAGGYLCDMPFGGYKQSGIRRQWGPEGFDELMELTSLSTPA